MFQIVQRERIRAPRQRVWEVICKTDDYPEWNPFVVACDSSFAVGSPIRMRVRVLPWFAMPQTETVRANREGEFLEYGIRLPLGLLESSRQHYLSELNANTSHSESRFCLRGPLAPLVARIAAEGGYEFRTVGDVPAVPVVVDITRDNETLVEVLRNVGYQATGRALVSVDVAQRRIEVRYGPN